MGRHLKKSLAALLVFLTALAAMSVMAGAAGADNGTSTDISTYAVTGSTLTSNNKGDQNYATYGSPAYSYLAAVTDGYMRVEYTGSSVAVEYYDKNFNMTGNLSVAMDLPLFGGFYAGSDAYYLVFGQENPDESNSQEVLRIVKYDKNWGRLNQASLYGANTTTPFSLGSCHISEGNGYLFIRTCHQMYAILGETHQANMTVVLRESDMSVIYSYYDVANNSTGYVSHSFNQYILADDENNVIALDHGDFLPRSFVLFKYSSKAGSGTFSSSNTHFNAYSFQGYIGENQTGASVGGLEYSSSSYLAACNSVTQDSNWDSHTARNVFLIVTDRSNFSSSGTEIKWITNYDTDGSVSASTPQLVKTGSDSFLLLWTTTENSATKLHYVYLDGKGNTTSEIYTTDGYLSDCQPVANSDGSVAWYVTGINSNSSTPPTFYVIGTDHKLSTSYAGFTGFSNDSGEWCYYVNGEIDKTCNSVIEGTVNGQYGWWYVVGGKVQLGYTGVSVYGNANGYWYIQNGMVDFNKNGVEQNSEGWWYVVGGRVDFSYTGVSNYGNANGYWYIQNGKVDFSKNSVEPNDYGWWYVVGGQVQFGYTGVANYANANGWWYIQNGKVDFSRNSVEPNSQGWWYVVGGRVDFSYTGVSNYGNANGYWYIQNGRVDFSKNSVEPNDYGWWYVTGGKVQFGYTGVADHANAYGWWYIQNGKVDFTKNSIEPNSQGWWYVTGGQVDFGRTGIDQNQYGWWRVVNGKVDFTCNSVEENQYGWWYVVGGKVQFDYTGVANYANANGWWYISGGRVDFTYTGTASNRLGTWYCVNGKVDFSRS